MTLTDAVVKAQKDPSISSWKEKGMGVGLTIEDQDKYSETKIQGT